MEAGEDRRPTGRSDGGAGVSRGAFASAIVTRMGGDAYRLRSAGLERGPKGTPKPTVNNWWLIPDWLMRLLAYPNVARG